MILVISHRYPRLGAVLSMISNIAFIAYGLVIANRFMVITVGCRLADAASRLSFRFYGRDSD